MHDLVGAYQRIERSYRLYIKSAFPLRSSALAQERDSLLSELGVISHLPLVETVPVYPLTSYTIADAAKLLPSEFSGLAPLAQTLFPPNLKLYQHQWQSLREVLVNHKDIVVTTGTGSGKTECFLLPLIAQLARESTKWQLASNPP